jgi:hypothetical protein
LKAGAMRSGQHVICTSTRHGFDGLHVAIEHTARGSSSTHARRHAQPCCNIIFQR